MCISYFIFVVLFFLCDPDSNNNFNLFSRKNCQNTNKSFAYCLGLGIKLSVKLQGYNSLHYFLLTLMNAY